MTDYLNKTCRNWAATSLKSVRYHRRTMIEATQDAERYRMNGHTKSAILSDQVAAISANSMHRAYAEYHKWRNASRNESKAANEEEIRASKDDDAKRVELLFESSLVA